MIAVFMCVVAVLLVKSLVRTEVRKDWTTEHHEEEFNKQRALWRVRK